MTTPNALKAVATGAQSAQEARSPYEQLKRQLETSKAEFLPLMGHSMQNVDRFIRVVLNAVLANADLLDAERRSLIASCMKAAQDGLMPDGREAVLNIYNVKVKTNGQPDRWIKKAQYLPMVGGLVKKLYESGEVTYIDAACVYEKDRFTYRRGDEPSLEHEPTLEDAPGKIVAAYAVIKLKNGEVKREVMPRRDIESVRAASKSADSGPWKTWYDQQAIKSVIKRAYKQLPKADKFEELADYDNQALGFTGTAASVADVVRGAAPALENNPSETLDMPMDLQHGEDLSVRQDAQDVSEAIGARAEPTDDGAPQVTLAALKQRLGKTKDRDVADVILDEGRGALSPEDYTELEKAHAKQFPAT